MNNLKHETENGATKSPQLAWNWTFFLLWKVHSVSLRGKALRQEPQNKEKKKKNKNKTKTNEKQTQGGRERKTIHKGEGKSKHHPQGEQEGKSNTTQEGEAAPKKDGIATPPAAAPQWREGEQQHHFDVTNFSPVAQSDFG